MSQSDINLRIVEKRLEELKEMSHTKNEAIKALDFYDDLTGDGD